MIADGIRATAQSLGIDPIDLATAISYETAGTFDPTKAGPTTQWGQHRGLIQFGEPQAKQYGVDWDDPVGSQLGPDGAVASYLRDTGVEPGMGLLDIYSAINAGGVGRYGASDANNGGAPGSVRDKVEQQMSGHRQKAAELLGIQDIADDTMSALGKEPQMAGLLNVAASTKSPQAAEQKPMTFASGLRDAAQSGALFDQIATAFNSMRHRPDPNIGQMASQRQEGRREAAVKNRTVEWLRSQGREDLAAAVEGGAIGGKEAFGAMVQPAAKPIEINGQLVDPSTGKVIGDYRTQDNDRTAMIQNYEYLVSQGMSPEQALQAARGGQTINVGGNEGPQVGTIPQGYELFQNPESGGYQMRPIEGGPADTSQKDAARTAGQVDKANLQIEEIRRARDVIENYPGRTTGMGGQLLDGIPGTRAHDVSALLETVGANISFETLNQMRQQSPTGGALGSVTENELAMLRSTMGNIRQSQSQEQLLQNLSRLEDQMLEVIHGPQTNEDPLDLLQFMGDE